MLARNENVKTVARKQRVNTLARNQEVKIEAWLKYDFSRNCKQYCNQVLGLLGLVRDPWEAPAGCVHGNHVQHSACVGLRGPALPTARRLCSRRPGDLQEPSLSMNSRCGGAHV